MVNFIGKMKKKGIRVKKYLLYADDLIIFGYIRDIKDIILDFIEAAQEFKLIVNKGKCGIFLIKNDQLFPNKKAIEGIEIVQ